MMTLLTSNDHYLALDDGDSEIPVLHCCAQMEVQRKATKFEEDVLARILR
jgi:hypothetical protein